ncbi:MAG: endonuclease/exonuclease/phosphatase family protein [Acidobacteriota bacterium]|nr:endonuclease/exonuclease/phosphatase family protein [Acidobacteriota bacterium]
MRLTGLRALAMAGAATLAGVVGAVPGSALEIEVRAMSFNVRYGSAEDGPNHWLKRRESVIETLASDDFDFIGLQEALPFQIEEIAAALPQFGVLSRTREVDPAEGEACTVLFRKDRWTLDRRQNGTFWLSETPDVAGSKSWDAALPRIATWGLFSEAETGARIHVFNTHFDHRGQESRERSAALLRRRVAEYAGDGPLLLMGDFNSGEDNAAMRLLRAASASGPPLVDSFRVVHPDATETYTFNGWGSRSAGEKIDAIFVRADANVAAARIARPRFEGRAPSDHDPVTVALRLKMLETWVAIVDLGSCRSCAGRIAREMETLESVLRARLHATEPRIQVFHRSLVELPSAALADVVRGSGYTPGQIELR